MLSFVLLSTAFLSVYSDSDCYFDIERLRCWCRDKNGITIFRMRHIKGDNSSWSVEYEPTNEECGPKEVIDVLPPIWIPGRNPPAIINDPCNTTVFIEDPEKEKEIIEKGYERIGNSLYKLHPKGINWDFARRTCKNEDAQLAIINSRIEAEYIAVFFQNQSSIIENVESKDSVFIGFHDIFEEGEYLTVEGVPLADTGFNVWAPNEPDNNGVLEEGNPGADCGGLSKTGTLTDLYCDGFYAFICEVKLRYAKPGKIDYSNGVFVGREGEVDEPSGTKQRTEAGIGYYYYAGFGFYRYHTTPMVWQNARLWCEREGAYLAIINSDEELELLMKIVKRVPKQFIKGRYKKFAVYTGRPKTGNDTLGKDEVESEKCRSSEGGGDIAGLQCQVKNVFVCEKNLLME